MRCLFPKAHAHFPDQTIVLAPHFLDPGDQVLVERKDGRKTPVEESYTATIKEVVRFCPDHDKSCYLIERNK